MHWLSRATGAIAYRRHYAKCTTALIHELESLLSNVPFCKLLLNARCSRVDSLHAHNVGWASYTQKQLNKLLDRTVRWPVRLVP
jgi:hypothetical protein